MQMTSNTILITGGGSGIGRALAEQFYALGNTVIIAGRRRSALDEVTAAHPGIQSRVLDLEDAAAVQHFAEGIKTDFPTLNAVLHNAGIMRDEPV